MNRKPAVVIFRPRGLRSKSDTPSAFLERAHTAGFNAAGEVIAALEARRLLRLWLTRHRALTYRPTDSIHRLQAKQSARLSHMLRNGILARAHGRGRRSLAPSGSCA